MKSYINYLKRQNRYIQDIHAIVFATALTSIIALIWLQYRYDVFTPQYKRIQITKTNTYIDKNRNTINNILDINNVENTNQSATATNQYTKYDPIEAFYKILKDAKNVVGQ